MAYGQRDLRMNQAKKHINLVVEIGWEGSNEVRVRHVIDFESFDTPFVALFSTEA